jgi:hypothetical protein
MSVKACPAAWPLLCRKMLWKKSKTVSAFVSVIFGKTPDFSAALMAGKEICQFVGWLFLLRAKSHSR